MNDIIFWTFWCGLYTSTEDISNAWTHVPYIILIVILLCEKFAQRWCKTRFGCTLEKVNYFKTLDEKIRIINLDKNKKETDAGTSL
jgi:hypothetical protein